MTPDEALRLYKVPDLAKLWLLSPAFLYCEIREGRLPAVHLGNGDRVKLRVRASDADAYISAKSSAAAS